jgi:hypothetical protein
MKTLLRFFLPAVLAGFFLKSDICFGAESSLTDDLRAPLALYLTWQSDPTTTMTIQWHTEENSDDTGVDYGPINDDALAFVPATSEPMVFSDRTVHTAEIVGLEPDSQYRFRTRNAVQGEHSDFFKFSTMPTTADRPIRAIFGGDVMHRAEWMAETNRQAMRFDPDFIVWGGDLAYSNGNPDLVDREYTFFEVMTDTLISDEGRVVPVLMGIGNHEVDGGYYWGKDRGWNYEDSDAFREKIAPYYYNLFAFPGQPGYAVLDFGDYMSVILLDSDHSNPIEGTQTEWLERILADRQEMTHIFPVYHVPGYPSVRYGTWVWESMSQRVREHWIPLFEQYGVGVAFENHDHTYKRTVPILNEAEHEDGVVFIGDGNWGTGSRDPHKPEELWYLKRSASDRHFILLTLKEEFADFKIINSEGKLIDHFIP